MLSSSNSHESTCKSIPFQISPLSIMRTPNTDRKLMIAHTQKKPHRNWRWWRIHHTTTQLCTLTTTQLTTTHRTTCLQRWPDKELRRTDLSEHRKTNTGNERGNELYRPIALSYLARHIISRLQKFRAQISECEWANELHRAFALSCLRIVHTVSHTF